MRPNRKSDVVADALAAGKLWRAKEILSGRIASQPYSPALYEQFGALLLRIGDWKRARPVGRAGLAISWGC